MELIYLIDSCLRRNDIFLKAMNYIGSKLKLLKFLEDSINKVVTDKDYRFSDLFAGTGVVGQYFKRKWHQVTANDLQYYSFVINKNYIWNHKDLHFVWLVETFPQILTSNIKSRKQIILDYLQNLKGKKWFIYKNYALGGTKWTEHERLYFSDENAMKCDAIRSQIEKWKKEEKITDNEYYFLLTSLLEAIDKVANTASVYGAFLKKLKISALKPLTLLSPDFYLNDHDHEVHNADILEVAKMTSHDVVYLDPPYNERQYSANYHILETIAKYDNPTIKWKTGLRDYSKQKSDYCKKSEVKKSFSDLIQTLDAKYIFLSYNNEGLMSLEEIREIMSTRWDYGVFEQKYQRFKADKTESRNHKKDFVVEYLHYVKVKR
jgi:adenine-specific DNA-methyltransferase